MSPLRINIVSESGGFEAQGVHTAFVDMVEALRARPEVLVLVNSGEPADILHAHTFGWGYWGRRRAYPGRRIMTAHVIPDSFKGSLVGWRLWMPLANWYLKLAYNSAEVVLAVAPHVKEELVKIGVRRPIEVLTNPVNEARFYVDPAFRAEGRRRLGLPEDAKVCLGVGQIQPRKGIRDFIETGRLCADTVFVWLGGRPFKGLTDGVAELDRAMASAPPNVRFPGTVPLEDMRLYYSAADLFFFPSLQENCALAINEAMACGIPMLLRDNPEYPPLYGDGHYLKALDPAGYAAQTGRFFGDGAERARLRQASLDVARRFSVASYAEFLVRLYERMMVPNV
jgi:1,2-diacylglycerol-3-alpha-glucose alpha-1,2-galactosyltransferase